MMILIASAILPQNFAAAQSGLNELKPGASMPAFELQDFRGKTFKSSEFGKAKASVVVFFGVECPLVKLHAKTLNDLQQKYDDVQIVGINSNRHDSMTEIGGFAKLSKIKFPLLKDVGNRVADQFGAQRTPQVFLFDQNQKLVYIGAIDDRYSYGVQREKAENNYLADAIVSVLDEKPLKTASTDPVGCIIGRVLKLQSAENAGDVTYAKQISRLLNTHCVSCHRPGEIAPFSLTDYDEVVGWAEMIQEVVNERRMPPWHANPAHGKFKNDTSLSADQIEWINTWVKNGAPLGDENDMPEPPEFVEGWRIGEPDVVIPMTNVTSKCMDRLSRNGSPPRLRGHSRWCCRRGMPN
jgi:peroxiredoxin